MCKSASVLVGQLTVAKVRVRAEGAGECVRRNGSGKEEGRKGWRYRGREGGREDGSKEEGKEGRGVEKRSGEVCISSHHGGGEQR